MFSTDASEKAYNEPITMQLKVGSNNHDGVLDSFDFCTNGVDIIFSSVFVIKNNWSKKVKKKTIKNGNDIFLLVPMFTKDWNVPI